MERRIKEGFLLTEVTSGVTLIPLWDHTVGTDAANIVRTWKEKDKGRACTHKDFGRGVIQSLLPALAIYVTAY